MTSIATRQPAPPTVLIVDDNPVNLQVMLQTLGGKGYRLLVAKTGEQALKTAREARPGLILLDIMMPVMDGLETCRHLKSDPATHDIPVIFLSALGESGDKVKGLELGAVDYITKPIQPDEVVARVNTHLTISRLSAELRVSRDNLERELANVAEMQRLLLPPELPDIAGLALAARYLTSRHAGGDYYDLRPLPGGRLGIIIADVAGHGATAAVIMAMMRSALHCYPRVPSEPGLVLRYLNQHFEYLWGRSLFITALYAVVDPPGRPGQSGGLIRVASAGHPLPLLCRRGQVQPIDGQRVIPMMIDSLDRIPVSEVELLAGDRLLFYTDGIVEQFSPRHELFGEDRLTAAFAATTGMGGDAAAERIVDLVTRFADSQPRIDDQTLLIVEAR